MRYLKNCQAEGWRLFVGLTFTKKELHDRALPGNFKNSLTLISSLFFSNVPVCYELQLKGHFFEISRRITFQNIPSDSVFEKVVECRNFTSYFTSGFTTRRSQSNFKNLKKTHKNHLIESVFGIVISDSLNSLNSLKRTLPKMFFWESSEISKIGVFPNIPWKMQVFFL